jgi:hypothetical protein
VNRGGKSRDLFIQLSMQVSENVRVWHPQLGVIGANGECVVKQSNNVDSSCLWIFFEFDVHVRKFY